MQEVRLSFDIVLAFPNLPGTSILVVLKISSKPEAKGNKQLWMSCEQFKPWSELLLLLC